MFLSKENVVVVVEQTKIIIFSINSHLCKIDFTAHIILIARNRLILLRLEILVL